MVLVVKLVKGDGIGVLWFVSRLCVGGLCWRCLSTCPFPKSGHILYLLVSFYHIIAPVFLHFLHFSSLSLL